VATSFLPCEYSSQNTVIIMIVRIYDVYSCQKIFIALVSEF
jgi:hypothetical protein